MRMYLFRAGVFVVCLAVALSPNAFATTLLTDKQISTIQMNCSTIKTGLQRLQQSDKLLRVSLGQRYENISQRLMAPLNSRIALNGLNGVDLTQTTVKFNTGIDDFRDVYTVYVNKLATVIGMDCKTDPIGFYNTIVDLRDSRLAVYDDTKSLGGLLVTYRAQFAAFAKSQEKK